MAGGAKTDRNCLILLQNHLTGSAEEESRTIEENLFDDFCSLKTSLSPIITGLINESKNDRKETILDQYQG